jgi:hypothetical protein
MVEMPQQQPNYQAPRAYEIELALQRIAAAPDDLLLYEELRTTSLRYKADGGPPLGMLEQFRFPGHDPIERLLRFARLWSFDAGNASWIPRLLTALSAAEQAALEELRASATLAV